MPDDDDEPEESDPHSILATGIHTSSTDPNRHVTARFHKARSSNPDALGDPFATAHFEVMCAFVILICSK